MNGAISDAIKGLKPAHWVFLACVLSVMGAAAYYGYTVRGESEGEQLIPVQNRSLVKQVSIQGDLVFPNKFTVTFDSDWVVEEVLVKEGQRVEAGQVLAKLDALTLANLRRNVAQERVNLQNAQKALADLGPDHALKLAGAREAMANAEVSLWDALNALTVLETEHARQLAKAHQAKADAQVALEEAQTALAHFNVNLAQRVAEARKTNGDAEAALEAAEDARAEFFSTLGRPISFNDRAIAQMGRLDLAIKSAQANLAKSAQDLRALENGLSALGIDQPEVAAKVTQAGLRQTPAGSVDPELGVNALKRQQLLAAVKLDQATLKAADEAVSELKDEGDLQDIAIHEASVAAAETDLRMAEEALASLKALKRPNPPPEVVAQEAQVAAAGANLTAAKAALTAIAAGANPQEVGLKQAQVVTAQVSLSQAVADLTELLKGPDPVERALLEAEVTAAELALAEAIKRAESPRAPLAGVVSLVTVKPHQKPGKDAESIEIVDPSLVEVDGIIAANSIQFVEEGHTATVSINALAGHVLQGTVASVAFWPTTDERGAASYHVALRVEAPHGVQVPVGVSSVSTVGVYGEIRALMVPRSAIEDISTAPVVRVKRHDGVTEARSVQLSKGDQSDYPVSPWVVVTHGLSEGEVVIVKTARASPMPYQ